MNKFVFKLEPLYDYRQRLQDICQKEFGEALKRLEDEESRLNAMKAEAARASVEADAMKEKGAPMEEVKLHVSYIAGLKRHMEAQEAILLEARDFLEAKRGKLIEASKEKRVVEIMKEKSYGRYVEEMNRQDQKATDDLVTSRFKRSTD